MTVWVQYANISQLPISGSYWIWFNNKYNWILSKVQKEKLSVVNIASLTIQRIFYNNILYQISINIGTK